MKRHLAFAATFVLLLASAAPAQSTPRYDRLERLVAGLEQPAVADHFNIACWGTMDDANDPNYYGCAGGHATRLFASEGLRLRPAGLGGGGRTVTYGRYEGVDALRVFFGLNGEEGVFLFTGGGHAGRDVKVEVRNIRLVMARHLSPAILVASRCP